MQSNNNEYDPANLPTWEQLRDSKPTRDRLCIELGRLLALDGTKLRLKANNKDYEFSRTASI
jgi:hypothetical protein